MMAQAADHNQVSVISPRFCVPRPVDLAISERVWQITGRGDFVVKDGNGNLMFRVEGSGFSLHDRKVILDSAGLPVVTLRSKTFSAHSRWLVYRGESTEDKDLIFTARRSSAFQMKTKLHVFLANNTSEDACDYAVQGSWFDRSCKVYVGDTSAIAAQMHKNSSIGSAFTGKNRFMVTVCPNVDCAFIVALIVILDEINSQAGQSSHDSHMSTHTSAHVDGGLT